jgi:hypothetical protein
MTTTGSCTQASPTRPTPTSVGTIAPCICLLHGPNASMPATQEDLFCDGCRDDENCIEFRAQYGTLLEPKEVWDGWQEVQA